MANTGRRYTHEQIIAILKEAEAAPSAAEVIRRARLTHQALLRQCIAGRCEPMRMDLRERQR
jgi:hypothetical protein